MFKGAANLVLGKNVLVRLARLQKPSFEWKWYGHRTAFQNNFLKNWYNWADKVICCYKFSQKRSHGKNHFYNFR